MVAMALGKKAPKKDPSYRKLKADYYPVQRKVQLGTSVAATVYNLDVGRVLSSVNHRLYRQGKTYQVKIDLDNRADTNPTGNAQFEVYALVDTWYIQKAWQMARQTYLMATAEERALMSGQKIARWEDFRVGNGIASELIHPYRYSPGLAGAVDTAGEFTITEIRNQAGQPRVFTWTDSPGATEFGMLLEYDKSGDTDLSPSTIDADNAYSGIDANVNELQMDSLAADGDNPPYNAQNFSGSVWVRVARLDNSRATGLGGANDSRMTTGFFNAPCGLVAIRPVANHQLAGELSLTVKAGDYKGVAAMNMGA